MRQRSSCPFLFTAVGVGAGDRIWRGKNTKNFTIYFRYKKSKPLGKDYGAIKHLVVGHVARDGASLREGSVEGGEEGGGRAAGRVSSPCRGRREGPGGWRGWPCAPGPRGCCWSSGDRTPTRRPLGGGGKDEWAQRLRWSPRIGFRKKKDKRPILDTGNTYA